MPYVYSTATSDIKYTDWKPGKDINRPEKSVVIKGGTNVITKSLLTPMGVATKVTDEELEFLLANKSFKKHCDRGYMRYDKTKKDPEVVVAKGMQTKDRSAPKTPETIAEEGAKLAEGTKNKGKKSA